MKSINVNVIISRERVCCCKMNSKKAICLHFLFLVLLAKSGHSVISDSPSNLETIENPQHAADSLKLQTIHKELETIALLHSNSHVSLWRKLNLANLDPNVFQDSISIPYPFYERVKQQTTQDRIHHNNHQFRPKRKIRHGQASERKLPQTISSVNSQIATPLTKNPFNLDMRLEPDLRNVSNNIEHHFALSLVSLVLSRNNLTKTAKILSPGKSWNESFFAKPITRGVHTSDSGLNGRLQRDGKQTQQSEFQLKSQSVLKNEKIESRESSQFFNNPNSSLQISAELPQIQIASSAQENQNKSHLLESASKLIPSPVSNATQVEEKIRSFSRQLPSTQNFNPKLILSKPNLSSIYENHLERKFVHPTAKKNRIPLNPITSLSVLKEALPKTGGFPTTSSISPYSTHVFNGGESGFSPNHSLRTQHLFVNYSLIPSSWKPSPTQDLVDGVTPNSAEWQNDVDSQSGGESKKIHIQNTFDTSNKKVFLSSPTSFVTVENFSVIYAKMESDTDINNSFQSNCTHLCANDSESDNNTKLPDSEEPYNRTQLEQGFKQSHPVELWESLGFYDDAYLAKINSHWLQFAPADPIVHKILAFCYTIICLLGCGGNLLVIFMCIRCPSLRNPPIYLVVNLAVSDFFMLAKMPIFIYNSYYEGPALGAIGCQIYGFLGGLTGTCSIMTLAAISLDRYYVIAYPFNPLKRTSSSRACCMMIFVWIYSTIFSSLPLFGINAYVSEGYLTSCSFEYLSSKMSDKIFVFVFFLAAYVLPLILIVYSYVNIFIIVKKSAEVQQFSGEGSGESFKCKHDKRKQKAEIKIAQLSFIIILVWSLAWSPYAIVALLGIFGYHSLITPLVSGIPALFCKTASCIDPWIYAINHPKFQRELKNKFPCFHLVANKRRAPIDRQQSNTDGSQSNIEDYTMIERTSVNKVSIKNRTRSNSAKSEFAKDSKLSSKSMQTAPDTKNIAERKTSTNIQSTNIPFNYELQEVVSYKDGDIPIKQNPKNEEKVVVCAHTQTFSTNDHGPNFSSGESSCGRNSRILQCLKNDDPVSEHGISPCSNEDAISLSQTGTEKQINMSSCEYFELKTTPNDSAVKESSAEISSQSQGECTKMSPGGKSYMPLKKIVVMNQQKDRNKSESEGENISVAGPRVKLETLIM